MMDWQPIDTAPKDRQLLMWEPFEPMICLGRWNDEDGEWSRCESNGTRFWKQPTHWMEAPEPPK